jgi:hypothetical protein
VLKHEGEEPRRFRKMFYVTGILRLTQGQKSVLVMKEKFWKNNLNFVQDASIIILDLIPEKILRSLSFIPPFIIKDTFTSKL